MKLYKPYIEYADYDLTIPKEEVIQHVFKAVDLQVDGVFVFPQFVSAVRDILPRRYELATAIDYPLGLSDVNIRAGMAKRELDKGVTRLDLVSNTADILYNAARFEKSVKIINDLCEQYYAELRLMIDYRQLSMDNILEIAIVLTSLGVEYILPATGYTIDELDDHLIVCRQIEDITKKGIKSICTASVFNLTGYAKVTAAKIYGLRTNSLGLISKIVKV